MTAGELGTLFTPATIEHLRQAVYNDVKEAADAQADHAGDDHRQQRFGQ
jgi:hypothetical protein